MYESTFDEGAIDPNLPALTSARVLDPRSTSLQSIDSRPQTLLQTKQSVTIPAGFLCAVIGSWSCTKQDIEQESRCRVYTSSLTSTAEITSPADGVVEAERLISAHLTSASALSRKRAAPIDVAQTSVSTVSVNCPAKQPKLCQPEQIQARPRIQEAAVGNKDMINPWADFGADLKAHAAAAKEGALQECEEIDWDSDLEN